MPGAKQAAQIVAFSLVIRAHHSAFFPVRFAFFRKPVDALPEVFNRVDFRLVENNAENFHVTGNLQVAICHYELTRQTLDKGVIYWIDHCASCLYGS